jgi:hypothetical protein
MPTPYNEILDTFIKFNNDSQMAEGINTLLSVHCRVQASLSEGLLLERVSF